MRGEGVVVPRPERLVRRSPHTCRSSTLISLATGLLQQGSWLLFLSVLVNRVPALAGWGHAELPTYVIPFGVTGFYPAAYLLPRPRDFLTQD
jgi:ABC-type uncharacterized transport system permease subunit